jgi:hypothetical protein
MPAEQVLVQSWSLETPSIMRINATVSTFEPGNTLSSLHPDNQSRSSLPAHLSSKFKTRKNQTRNYTVEASGEVPQASWDYDERSLPGMIPWQLATESAVIVVLPPGFVLPRTTINSFPDGASYTFKNSFSQKNRKVSIQGGDRLFYTIGIDRSGSGRTASRFSYSVTRDDELYRAQLADPREEIPAGLFDKILDATDPKKLFDAAVTTSREFVMHIAADATLRAFRGDK